MHRLADSTRAGHLLYLGSALGSGGFCLWQLSLLSSYRGEVDEGGATPKVLHTNWCQRIGRINLQYASKIAKHPASHWFPAQRCMHPVQHIALSLTFSLTYTCSNKMLSCLDLAPMLYMYTTHVRQVYTISCPLGMSMLQAADDKVMAESMSGRHESITAPSSCFCTG